MPFKINNVSDQKLNVHLVAAPDEYVKIELPDSIEPGKTASGMVHLLKEAFDDEFEKSFTIEFDDEAKSRFTIPLKRQILYAGGAHAAQTKDEGSDSP